MAKKFNLAEFLPEAVSKMDHSRIVEIPLPKIIANGRNFYGVRDVEALADSIALNGLLEPLIVYPYGSAQELYRLISGHRRLAALQMNKAETAPCRIVDKPASTAREDLLLISANGQRVKTGPEVAAEAQRMTDALLALKKEGAELPGRLRDMVAEALGVSSTALARKKVINEGLKVPGFRQAWESGKMGETVAYELAQLPPEKQYEALDQLIDEGVNYEKADIKTVQRIKRKVEAGESTTQDLAAEAEKRGIECPNGDYSPLLAELVREAIPSWERWDVLECPTKAAGVDLLHQFGLTRHSSSGGAIWFDSDPQALTLQRPICKRIKWPEVWELLALDAMQRQAVEVPAEDEKARAGGPSRTPAPTREPEADADGADEVYMATSRVIDPDWMTGDPPGDGRYLCFARLGAFGEKEYTCERIGDAWWVFDAPAPATFDVLGWWPLPGRRKETANG